MHYKATKVAKSRVDMKTGKNWRAKEDVLGRVIDLRKEEKRSACLIQKKVRATIQVERSSKMGQ